MEITNENNAQQLAIPSLLERIQYLEFRSARAEEANNYLITMLQGTNKSQSEINARLDELSDGQKKMMKKFRYSSVRIRDPPIVEKHVYDEDAIIDPTQTQTPIGKEKDNKKSGSIRKRGRPVIAKKPKTVLAITVEPRRSLRLLSKQIINS